jgi:hypothetical protein
MRCTIALYLALISLFVHVFRELGAESTFYLARASACGTALFSYLVIQQSTTKLVTHFVVELSQNLYLSLGPTYCCGARS